MAKDTVEARRGSTFWNRKRFVQMSVVRDWDFFVKFFPLKRLWLSKKYKTRISLKWGIRNAYTIGLTRDHKSYRDKRLYSLNCSQ